MGVFFCFSPLPDEMDDLVDDNTLSLSQSFLFFFVLTLLYYSTHHYCDIIVDLKK